jgi:polyisoprenoid-binding protein YceI
MTDSAVQIPGFIAGTWAIDPNHSEVSFTVGHLVVSKVRGRFDAYNGTIVTDEALGHSSVDVTIDAASVNTHMPVRDKQVRSADFLDVEHFPNITFTSSAVRNEQGHYFVDGDLTIRGTSRPVTLDVTVNGFSPTRSAQHGRPSARSPKSTEPTSVLALTPLSPAAITRCC